ncbi:MAG: hypothetical protein JWQ88_3477 [Rhodoferax sp.]|nr:hypothetical protein [Rhodoferax sp.]
MSSQNASSSRTVVIAALLGNLAIAVVKFIAAGLTGSSAMLSEGVHSLVDTGNELLLLYGMARASKPPDENHPYGYGRELYFWAFIVALLVFALGAGVSIYEGVKHLREPEPMTRPNINYAVLGASMLFEGTSWFVALREFRSAKGRMGYVEAFRRSKDPTTFTVLFEDSAALAGLAIALAGVAASQVFDMPALDGVASILIGCVLAVTALLLARETKGLLMGEAAAPAVRASIMQIAATEEGVQSANGLITSQVGPQQVVASLSLKFHDGLAAADIEACVNRIEARIVAAHPEVVMLFVKPQTQAVWEEKVRRRNDAVRAHEAGG